MSIYDVIDALSQIRTAASGPSTKLSEQVREAVDEKFLEIIKLIPVGDKNE